MRTAGIREARQNLSVLLAAVGKGQQIVITDRGTPVARLVPPLPLSAQPFPGRAGLRRRMPALRPPLSAELAARRPAAAPWDMALGGPLYLDASVLAALYFPEPDSAPLERALRGRRDLTVSDLAASELVAAFARRRRSGRSADAAARFHAALLADLEAGIYRRAEIVPATHRAAERLLLSVRAPLRARDALHLALAMTAGVGCLLTFDASLAAGARALGLPVRP